jgi:hypothetical protein
MSINWDMAGRGNNALAYFQLGQQLGQQVIDGRVNRAVGKIMQADQPGQMPNGQAPDLSREWQTVAQNDPRLFGQLQQQRAAVEKQRAETEAGNRRMLRRMLKMAGTNPQQAFTAAREQGIPLDNVPQPGTPEFEPWRQTQLFILEAVETPEGKDMLTNAAKEYMLTLPPDQRDPNNPAFYQGFGKYLQNKEMRLFGLQPGGALAGIDPVTGNPKVLVAPNPGGFAAGTPVGTPPPAASPPPAAIDYLRKNPTLKAEFDAKYGPGAADRVLGGQPAGNPPFGG